MYTVPGTLGRAGTGWLLLPEPMGGTWEGGLTQRMVSMGRGCCFCCGRVLDGFREGVLAMLFEPDGNRPSETAMH
ncbi:MAG: hypothetical protein IPL65_07350 [Lewinellaceae bacterium]|nr:hypothetical protein [Lewinellaceae bacterium]